MTPAPSTVRAPGRVGDPIPVNSWRERVVFAAAIVLVGALGAAFAIAFRLDLRGGFVLLLGGDDVLVAFGRLPRGLRVLLPTLGGAAAGLVTTLAARTPGYGVGEVLEAVAIGRGQLSLAACLWKSLASLCALVTGGSLGREGSIVQFGAGAGAMVGRRGGLGTSRTRVLVAFVVVTAARAVVVALVALALRPTRERFPASWVAVLTWGGLLGGLSMVLALALPASMPHRDLLVTMTFGVVVVSILGQGLTMGPLPRRLGLVAAGTDRVKYEAVRGAQQATAAAPATLDDVTRTGGHSEEVLDEFRGAYQARLAAEDERLRALRIAHEALRREERHGLARRLLLVERDAVQRAHRDGAVGAEAADELLRDVDGRLVALEDESSPH